MLDGYSCFVFVLQDKNVRGLYNLRIHNHRKCVQLNSNILITEDMISRLLAILAEGSKHWYILLEVMKN